MPMRTRALARAPAATWLSAVFALTVALLALALSACGNSAGSQVVLRVGDRSITRSTVEHWVHILAVKDYKLKPFSPVPAWVIPHPPEYRACAAHLQAEARAAAPRSAPQPPPNASETQAKAKCRAQYAQLRAQTISFLINSEALLQEGPARGLSESPREIKQRFARVKESEFPVASAFPRYLKIVGETLGDQMFRARIKVFTAKIEAQILGAKGQSLQQRYHALVQFGDEFPVRWAHKTHCEPGFVVANCSEYRGPEKPRLTI